MAGRSGRQPDLRGDSVSFPNTPKSIQVHGTYNSGCESGIRWDDPEIGINWPLRDVQLSEDRKAQTLSQWLVRPESEFFTLKDEAISA